MDCYVDADFAGFHDRDPDYSALSPKSRTGYIIMLLGGCPILWKSQLQTEISLSTLESEYSALSARMQTLLPLRSILGEIVKELKLPPDFKSTISCRVFEDNNGNLLLASKQRSRAFEDNNGNLLLASKQRTRTKISSGTMSPTATSKFLRLQQQIRRPIISPRVVSTAKLLNAFGSLHKVGDTCHS